MKFRTRLMVAMSSAIGATLLVSFVAVSLVVERSEERQLDEALRAEAHEEVIEIAASAPLGLHISDRAAPETGDFPQHAILYKEGRPVDWTPTMKHDPIGVDPLHRRAGVPFDIDIDGDRVRAMLAHVPGHPDLVLFLAATRDELEKDVRFLREVMFVAALLSILGAVLVSWSIVRGLTAAHGAIADAARRVAHGELEARVGLRSGDEDTVQLAGDIDRMIERLDTLVGSQQRFVAHAAHELRSPLSALYGELQLALRRERSADEYRAAIDQALGSARRLIALAEDLLALARLGADDEPMTEEVDARDVVDSAIAWARPAADTRRVRFVVEGDSASVVGRRFDLERMIRNLLENAVRYSPEGGEVNVSMRRRDGVLAIEVTDVGPGIAEEDRERVFEPFFRSADARVDSSGSGLGLPIAREIARAHGGDVVLEGSGSGARFVATLGRVQP